MDSESAADDGRSALTHERSTGPPEDPDRGRRWVERATVLSTVAGALVAVAALTRDYFDVASAPSTPGTPGRFSWTPFLAVALVAFVFVVGGVSFLAARAAIRRRETRRDAVEVLLSSELNAAGGDFSPQARTSYVHAVEQYAKSLLELARNSHARDGSDIVSQRHVERASEFLGTGYASRRGRHLGALGGVLLGTGLSVWTDILIDEKYNPVALVISLAATILGVSMVIYNWLRD